MKHKQHNMQETSIQSWKELQESLGKRQMEVYGALKELCQIFGDATDQEVKSHLMKNEPNYVRPRRYELVNDFKLIGFSQKRKCRFSKKTAMAWKVLDRRLI